MKTSTTISIVNRYFICSMISICMGCAALTESGPKSGHRNALSVLMALDIDEFKVSTVNVGYTIEMTRADESVQLRPMIDDNTVDAIVGLFLMDSNAHFQKFIDKLGGRHGDPCLEANKTCDKVMKLIPALKEVGCVCYCKYFPGGFGAYVDCPPPPGNNVLNICGDRESKTFASVLQ